MEIEQNKKSSIMIIAAVSGGAFLLCIMIVVVVFFFGGIRSSGGFTAPPDTLDNLTLSSDGTLIGAGGMGNLAVFDATTRAEVWSIFDEVYVFQIAFSPDGSLITAATRPVSGGGKITLSIYEASTGAEVFADTLRGESAHGLDWSADGSRLLVNTEERVVAWTFLDGEEVESVIVRKATRKEEFIGARFASSGSVLVYGGFYDRKQKPFYFGTIVNSVTGDDIGGMAIRYDEFPAFGWSDDGDQFAAATTQTSVDVWSANVPGAGIPVGGSGGVPGLLRFSPDGSQIIRADWDSGSISLIDIASGLDVWSVSPPNLAQGQTQIYFYSVVWSPDESIILVSEYGTLLVLDALTGEELYRLSSTPGNFVSALWLPDGQTVVYVDGKPGSGIGFLELFGE